MKHRCTQKMEGKQTKGGSGKYSTTYEDINYKMKRDQIHNVAPHCFTSF